MNLNVHLDTAKHLLEKYTGSVPFANYLKAYFKQNKKHGSTDRKYISAFCYAFFRTGKAFEHLAKQQKMAAGLFLASQEENPVLHFLNPEWNNKLPLAREEKIALLKSIDPAFSEAEIFPDHESISSRISKNEFILSHLNQRNVFIRARPGKEQTVNKILKEHSIPFERFNTNCFSLPPGFKIEKYFTLDKDIVVQDYSSQQTGNMFDNISLPEFASVWDCCAGSGGKSVMAYDKLVGIKLMVSDIRESILVNLRKRFTHAGIRNYTSLVADVQKESMPAFKKKFDCIIADVPCTGSGTWGRSPEQLYFFDRKRIDQYASIQKTILKNILDALKPGGYILYITCSVYKQENEQVVEYSVSELGLELFEQQIIEGHDKKADTMFVALLRLPYA